MVAALTRVFGIHNLALAEDVVQDAFCRALEVWKFRGVPENPSAWLMATAKHRAIDVLRRERTARTFAPELGRLLESEWTLVPLVEELFGPLAVKDDLLRMMFSCCNPRLAEEAQVALVLHILCGFGISEVAAAFLDTEAATQKRISRAKKVLAGSKRLFDLADADFPRRLSAVHRALYLLFNEGYHGASAESAMQVELCREAIRLATLLLEHPGTATPATYALAALMSLHAARLPGRVNAAGQLQTLFDQDRSHWDRELIEEGQRLLELSATGPEVTEYHVEAAIALVHARADRAEVHELGTNRPSVRHAGDDSPIADCRPEPGDCRRATGGPGKRFARNSRDRRARSAVALSVLFRRACRSRAQMRATGGGASAFQRRAEPRAQSHGARVLRAAHSRV